MHPKGTDRECREWFLSSISPHIPRYGHLCSYYGPGEAVEGMDFWEEFFEDTLVQYSGAFELREAPSIVCSRRVSPTVEQEGEHPLALLQDLAAHLR